MTDKNKENNEHLEKNQDDNFQKNNKKSNRNIIIRCFVYGLLSIFVLTLFIYMNFPKIKDFIQKETPQKRNIFVKGPNMHYYHNGPAVLLDDGNVLVIGGDTKQAEIYDYKKNKFVLTGEMNEKRYDAAATLLKDGNILVTGGLVSYNRDKELRYIIVENAEIYDIKTEKFKIIGKMCVPRMRHFAIPLDNGNVIFIGGQDKYGKPVSEIEEFDYYSKKFKIIGNFKFSDKSFYDSLLIPNKPKLLLFGSKSLRHLDEKIDFVIYNPNENSFIDIPSEFTHRTGSATLLDENKILIIGGQLGTNTASNSRAVSILDYKTGKIVYNNEKGLLEPRHDHTATKLNNGNIIIIGGASRDATARRILSDTIIYDTKTGSFRNNKAKLKNPRVSHTAVKLKNGNILILGGYIKKWNFNKTIEYKTTKTQETEIYIK